MTVKKLKLFAVLACVIFAGVVTLAQTPEEQEYDKWMKTVQATMGSIRTNLQGQKKDETAQDAATLVATFKNVEKFWVARKKDDAVDFAKKAGAVAAEVETAAKAGDFEKAGTTLRGIAVFCTGCHTAYRERYDDGTFRAKLGPTKPGSSQ